MLLIRRSCNLEKYRRVFWHGHSLSISLETADQQTGIRSIAGVLLFYDPPNGEIIEQFRQIERATERRMVAVHKIVFPEDTAPEAKAALG